MAVNRTNVELKFKPLNGSKGAKATVNRTNVELKFIYVVDTYVILVLLIAPTWN